MSSKMAPLLPPCRQAPILTFWVPSYYKMAHSAPYYKIVKSGDTLKKTRRSQRILWRSQRIIWRSQRYGNSISWILKIQTTHLVLPYRSWNWVYTYINIYIYICGFPNILHQERADSTFREERFLQPEEAFKKARSSKAREQSPVVPPRCVDFTSPMCSLKKMC